MATMDGSFPEVPEGFAVYRVIVKDLETGENIVKTKVAQLNAAKDGNNGPDDAVAKVMEDLMPADDFGGDTEERLYAFADRYRFLQVGAGMCECGLTAALVAGSAFLVLLVVYVVVAAFTFCRLDDNNFIRQLYRVAPVPEGTLRFAALTWPFWVWWKEECEW